MTILYRFIYKIKVKAGENGMSVIPYAKSAENNTGPYQVKSAA